MQSYKTSLGMITASLYDGPVYFSCYPDLTLALDDANIVKALTLNIQVIPPTWLALPPTWLVL